MYLFNLFLVIYGSESSKFLGGTDGRMNHRNIAVTTNSYNSLNLQNSLNQKETSRRTANEARRPDQPDGYRDRNTDEVRDSLHSRQTESSEAAHCDQKCTEHVTTDRRISRRPRITSYDSEGRTIEESYEHGSVNRSTESVESEARKESNIQNQKQFNSRETDKKQASSGRESETANAKNQENQEFDSPQIMENEKWTDKRPRRPDDDGYFIKYFDLIDHALKFDLGRINCSDKLKEQYNKFMSTLKYGLYYDFLISFSPRESLCSMLTSLNAIKNDDIFEKLIDLIKNSNYLNLLYAWYDILVPNLKELPKTKYEADHTYNARIDLSLHLIQTEELLKMLHTSFEDLKILEGNLYELLKMPDDPKSYPVTEAFDDLCVEVAQNKTLVEVKKEAKEGNAECLKVDRRPEHDIDPPSLFFSYKPLRRRLLNDPESPIFTYKAQQQAILEYESDEGFVTLSRHVFGENDERLDSERKNFSNKIYYDILYKFNIEKTENGELLTDHRKLACNQLLLSTLVRNWYVRGWDATRACLSGLHTPAYYMPADCYQTLTSPEFLMVVKIIANSNKLDDEEILEWVPGCDSHFIPKDSRAPLAMSRIFVRDSFEISVRALVLMATTVEPPEIYSITPHNLKDGMAKRTFNRFNQEAYLAHKDNFWEWINKQDFLEGRKFEVDSKDFEEYTIEMCKRKRLTVKQTKHLVTIAQSIRFIFEKDRVLLQRIFIAYMYDKTNVFIKDEFYPKSSTLRFIISPDPVVKIILGTVFRKIEEWLYFDDKSFLRKCNVKKLTYQQIDSKIMEQSRGCNVFLATDYSGYESSQGVEVQRMKFAVYKKFYNSDEFGGIILDLYFKYSCSPKKVYNKNFTMVVYSQQMSGFPDTACGNLLTNWINVTFFMILMPLMMLLEGDDGLLGFKSKEDVNVKEAIEHSLFPIDEFDFKESPFELSFCGHLQSPNGTPMINDHVYFEQKMCYMFSSSTQISYRKRYEVMYLRILSAQLLYPRDPHIASLWSNFKATFKQHYEVRQKTYEQFCRTHWWQLENGRYLFDYEFIPTHPLPIHEMIPNDFIVGDPDTNNEFLKSCQLSSEQKEISDVEYVILNFIRNFLIRLFTGADWLTILISSLMMMIFTYRLPAHMRIVLGIIVYVLRFSTSRFYPRRVRLFFESSDFLLGLFSRRRMADKLKKSSRGRTFMNSGLDAIDRLTNVTDDRHFTPYDLMAAHRWHPGAKTWTKRLKRQFLGDVKYLADRMSSRAFVRECLAYYENDPEFN